MTYLMVDDNPKPWPNDAERLRNGWPKCDGWSVLKEEYGSPRTGWLFARLKMPIRMTRAQFRKIGSP